MKTFILQLENHDDLISARDKMMGVKSGRILLVWPDHGRLLSRRLDLVLLKRFSTTLGAPLALVSKDPDVRYFAPRIGIPVYKSLQQAQNPRWRVPRDLRKSQFEETLSPAGNLITTNSLHKKPRTNISRLRPERTTKALSTFSRLVFFVLGVLALLLIAATLLPRAEIILNPQVQNQETSILVQANPDVNSVNLSGIVPVYLKTVIVEGRDSIPVSGSIILPDKSAAGNVVFTNLTDQKVTIPEGTIVRTLEVFPYEATITDNQSSEDSSSKVPTTGTISTKDIPLRFSVTQTTEVSAGPGISVTVPVRCLIPGSIGNLPANSLIAFEGLLGTKLKATNPEPTTNGSERIELAPTQVDRRKLALLLYEGLKETALEEIERDLSHGDILLYSSIELLHTVEETYLPADLQPADRLSLSQRLEFQASYVSEEDLINLAQAVLDAGLPENFYAIEESIEIKNLEKPVLSSDKIAHWNLYAHRQVQAKISKSQAIQLTLGLDPTQAQEQLRFYLLLGNPPHIKLFPNWWPRMPIIPFRIVIITV